MSDVSYFNREEPMVTFSYDMFLAACKAGGSSVLTFVTDLVPAAGAHAGVAPARYVKGSTATYAFETRFVAIGDGEPQAQSVVVLDSKGSSINRIESVISDGILDGVDPIDQTPHARITYDGSKYSTCFDLPHRLFDGHFRAGTIGGVDVTKDASFVAARNSTNANAKALIEMSPGSLLFGAWDSTRAAHQVRFRSALVGETIGVLADQSERGRQVDPRGAARFDTIAPSVRLVGSAMQELLDAQRDELSAGNVANIEKEIGKAKKGTVSGSPLGLGAIPPSLDALGLVSCARIIRSHVLSFSALRQLRFGLGAEGDATARALLGILGLNALVRSYGELQYRAGCDLREASRPVVTLDARYGETQDIDFPSIDDVDDLLREAIAAARSAGVRWEGQTFDVVGNPLIAGAISEDEEA